MKTALKNALKTALALIVVGLCIPAVRQSAWATAAVAGVVNNRTVVNFVNGLYIGNTVASTTNKLTNSRGASATVDFASKTDQCVDSSSITVTGAVAGDACAVGTPATVDTHAWYMCYVDAADSVKVKFCAHGTVNPASGTFYVRTFSAQ